MQIDRHTQEIIIHTFARKLSQLSPAEFGVFVASHDLKRKQEKRQREEKKKAAASVVVVASPQSKGKDVSLEPSTKKPRSQDKSPTKLAKQLSVEESSFFDSLGVICDDTHNPEVNDLSEQRELSEQHEADSMKSKFKKSKQKMALDELAKIQKRVEEILGECHDMDCECEDCNDEDSE